MAETLMLEKMRGAAFDLEEKIARVATLTGRSSEGISEPSLHVENRFLRAENEILRAKVETNEELMTLVQRQSEMLKLQSQALRRFES